MLDSQTIENNELQVQLKEEKKWSKNIAIDFCKKF